MDDEQILSVNLNQINNTRIHSRKTTQVLFTFNRDCTIIRLKKHCQNHDNLPTRFRTKESWTNIVDSWRHKEKKCSDWFVRYFDNIWLHPNTDGQKDITDGKGLRENQAERSEIFSHQTSQGSISPASTGRLAFSLACLVGNNVEDVSIQKQAKTCLGRYAVISASRLVRNPYLLSPNSFRTYVTILCRWSPSQSSFCRADS